MISKHILRLCDAGKQNGIDLAQREAAGDALGRARANQDGGAVYPVGEFNMREARFTVSPITV